MQNSLPSLLLSVVIPTLDEAENLPLLLQDLGLQERVKLEIIIGDGGSTDETRSIAERFGARFVAAGRGRGAQMNEATEQANGDFLLFLHADSSMDDPALLGNALLALISEQSTHERVAGHFRLHFKRTMNKNEMAYRYAEEKSAFNRVNTTNGDQGLLLPRSFFKDLGGFDESMPFLEDQRIAEKIRSTGHLITLPGVLNTSARRFEKEGFHRRYILMSMMMGLHSVGAESFFARAPGVYRNQQDTGSLLLSPFFALIWRMMYEEWGAYGSLRIFYLLGRYIRQNSWQMFFFLDVCLWPELGERRYPCLSFHDRLFWPCTNFKIFDALTGIFCFVWFMCILSPFFWIKDRSQKKYFRNNNGTSV